MKKSCGQCGYVRSMLQADIDDLRTELEARDQALEDMKNERDAALDRALKAEQRRENINHSNDTGKTYE